MISNLIVSRLDGQINFESEYEHGSTFTFTVKVEAFEASSLVEQSFSSTELEDSVVLENSQMYQMHSLVSFE